MVNRLIDFLEGKEIIRMGWDRYNNDFIEIEDDGVLDLSEAFDTDEYFDITDKLYDELERERIEQAFNEREGAGVQAHAYRHDLDNNLILRLWSQGWTLRKIGEKLGCSPNTVRNRIRRMGLNTDREWRE